MSDSREKFLSKTVDHYESATLKSKKSGRPKSNFEMKCFWYSPRNGKFTYRSDDTLKKLIENDKISPKDELRALQIQFAKVQGKARQITIYDNSVKFGENNVLLHYKNSTFLIDRLDW